MNRQSVFQSYFEGFNEQEMFEFLYQSDYKNYELNRYYPTERQVVYIAALLTELEMKLQFYGVEFKYQNGNKVLPKARNKFKCLKSYKETDLIIENLKLLLGLLDQYKNMPTLNLYTQIECSINVINKYFTIPNGTKLKRILKSKVDVKEIEAEEERKLEIKRKEELKKKKRAEELEKKRWLKGFSQQTVSCDVTYSEVLLEGVISEAGAVSRNQIYALVRQIEEAICFIKVIDETNDTFKKPYTLDVLKVMTAGEAGLLLNILKEFNKICWKEVEKRDNEFVLNTEKLLTNDFLKVIGLLGNILPYFKDVSSDLKPLSNTNVQYLKLKEKISQLTNYLEQYQTETVSIKFKSIFEKRHFLYLLQDAIYQSLVIGMTKEWMYLIDEMDLGEFLTGFIESCEVLLDNEKAEMIERRMEELTFYTKEIMLEFMMLD